MAFVECNIGFHVFSNTCWCKSIVMILQVMAINTYNTVHPRSSVPRLSEHQTWPQVEHNPILFSEEYKLMKFSFRRPLNLVEKLCCDYHECRTQKVIFFSAVVFSSVMPKNCPLRGLKKGQKTILDYPNFRYIRTARLQIEFSLFG